MTGLSKTYVAVFYESRKTQFGSLPDGAGLGYFVEWRELTQAHDGFHDAVRHVVHFFLGIETPQAEANRSVRKIV
jgi:hypothetical protein